MDIRYLSEKDMADFERMYPSAKSFLVSRSLDGELLHLRNMRDKGLLNAWEKNRLAELEAVR